MNVKQTKAPYGELSHFGITHALGIILPLCLLGALLGGLVVYVANDMYAFVKLDREITLTISSPPSEEELSHLLKATGIIENEFIFRMYLRSKNKIDLLSTLTGEFKLNSSMSYREILLEIF